MKKFLVLLILFVVFLPANVTAVSYSAPTKDFYVNDFANVLDSKTASYIIQESYALKQQTGAQVVVLTVPGLEGQPVEDYALNVLRTWGIGDKQKNNGVLILLSVGDKTSRIEVGYGLEGILPDAKTGRIQDQLMIPAFKEGNYSGGIVEGYKAIANEIYKENGIERSLPIGNTDGKVKKNTSENESSGISDFLSNLSPLQKVIIAIVIFVLFVLDWVLLGGAITRFIIFNIFLSFFRNNSGGRSGDSGGGGSGGGGGSSRNW